MNILAAHLKTSIATQVRDDPSSRLNSLTELEEDEGKELADIPTHPHYSDSLSQPVSYGYRLGENHGTFPLMEYLP